MENVYLKKVNDAATSTIRETLLTLNTRDGYIRLKLIKPTYRGREKLPSRDILSFSNRLQKLESEIMAGKFDQLDTTCEARTHDKECVKRFSTV